MDWPPPSQVSRRAPRGSIACEPCRKSKLRCDQNQPCGRCKLKAIECTFRQTSRKTFQVHRQVHPSRPNSNLSQYRVQQLNPQNPARSDQSRDITTQEGTACDKNGQGSNWDESLNNLSNSDSSSWNICALEQARLTHAPAAYLDRANLTQKQEESRSKMNIGLNNYTNGTEFYGPAADLSFLVELRSLAKGQETEVGSPESHFNADELYPDGDMTIDDEYASRCHSSQIKFLTSMAWSDSGRREEMERVADLDIEIECVQLYFTSLHLIYSILDQPKYMQRCKEEIWGPRNTGARQPRNSGTSRFISLYCAVLAIGALCAGDGSLLIKDDKRIKAFLNTQTSRTTPSATKRTYVRSSFELAHFFHVCTKASLGDIFEASSLEVSQTLLLMSIFSHYSLRPHAAYMYNGMSARTVFGMGSAQTRNLSLNSVEAIRTWWFLYSHEIEVCCSLGRETSLREPSYYTVYVTGLPTPLPEHFAEENDPGVFYGRSMTALADILRQASENLCQLPQLSSQDSRHTTAMELDVKLLDWKRLVARMYDLDHSSLTEQEEVTKRKIMLRLRFYSARIYIHRSFLVEAVSQGQKLATHIDICRQAAKETIVFLYDTLMHRPFFRTWFYNVMYNFQSTAVILYVLVLRPSESEQLLALVDKSLEIFRALNASSVARKCASQTQSILETIKSLRQKKSTNMPDANSVDSTEALVQRSQLESEIPEFSQDEFLNSLIGSDMLEIFNSNTEHLGWTVDSPNPSGPSWGEMVG